ncbi:MAG: hypothetical protein WB762_12970 [Candidatus Sulfotelmatobacter sp.]
MAGQSIEPREILRILAMAAGVATFPGFSRWTFAGSHIGNPLSQIKPRVYRPIVFSAPEYAIVERNGLLTIFMFARSSGNRTPFASMSTMISRSVALDQIFVWAWKSVFDHPFCCC